MTRPPLQGAYLRPDGTTHPGTLQELLVELEARATRTRPLEGRIRYRDKTPRQA